MVLGGVHATIGMARQEKYPKPGEKPVVKPATLHEDLRGRDFTINSMALELTPGSFGAFIDPFDGRAGRRCESEPDGEVRVRRFF